MAKQASAAQERPGFIGRIREFFDEVQNELGKVAWPSWDELKQSTFIVLVVLVAFAIIISIMDFIFNTIVLRLLALG